jgi:aerobic carbon-monoxide dehydrogenase medium subunit
VKPAPFRLHSPATVDEALDVLAELGPDAKVLAGGQSLLPMLNMRLAAPPHLVDVNRLRALATVEPSAGGVRVGALARHAQVLRDAGAAAAVPLLGQGLALVAHPVIRNRGTTVGSLVHADPSGEMTAVLTLLGGEVELRSRAGTRTVAAADFFLGPLESDVAAGELATSAWFPALPPRSGSAFREVARRSGDYAVCGVAAAVTLDPVGRVERARAAYISMSATPVVLDLTDAVAGRVFDAADWAAAARQAAGALEPEPDLHATAAYRRSLAETLTRQALGEAAEGARTATDAPLTATGGPGA